MAEKNQTTIPILEIDPTAMQQLVEYSYVGSIIITEDNVQVCKRNNGFFLFHCNVMFVHIQVM